MYTRDMSATTIVAVPCRLCSKVYEIPLDFKGFTAWREGKLIQDALPELSMGQRELLISRTCDECWKRLFGSDEE